MSNLKFACTLFCLTFTLTTTMISTQAQAAQYKGFPQAKESGMKAYVMNEAVIRFTETQNDFLILLDKHAALYRFPKKADSAADFRSFLNSRIQSKAKIHLVVNPRSTEILKISDEK